MKRTILLSALLAGLLAIRTNAGEAKPKVQPEPQAPSQDKQDKTAAEGPASDQPLPEPTEPVIPKRELVFEESDRKYPVKLVSTDPKLLEQRYVAVFRIVADRSGPRFTEGNLGGLYHSVILSGQPDWLGKLAENIPAERLPSRLELSMLTRDARRYVTYRTVLMRKEPGDLGVIEVNVHAPTPDLVKMLVTGIFQLFDYGLSFPIQDHCLNLMRELQEDLPGARARSKQANEELAELNRQLEAYQEYEDITEQSLTDLMTQRRLLLVELAGVEARIEACGKILARGLSPSGTERVEAIKISAEIELVGLQARRGYIDQVVEKGGQRLSLSSEAQRAGLEADKRNQYVSRIEGQLEMVRSERKRFEPFAIEGEKITIHPIEWKSPQDDQEHWWLR